jgi:hypothetical protein
MIKSAKNSKMANNGIQINVSYNEVYFISTCTFKNFH